MLMKFQILLQNGGVATAAISIDENGTAVTTVIATDVDCWRWL